MPFDVVVAGLGGFGSSAAHQLARRGLHVLGVDPRPGGHAEGSSHGESRIVRQVYFEGASYVPLLRRTYELWAGLTRSDGSPMLRLTGGLFLGAPGTRVLAGSVATAEEWGLDHEVLEADEVARRFPALRPPVGMLGLYEPHAGVVGPEQAVLAQLGLAAAAGAELCHDEAVTGWTATANGVRVTTTRRSLDAGALVLAPGRWAPDLLGGLGLPLVVERRLQLWFKPSAPADFAPGRMPVWIWDTADGTSLYGSPAVGPDGDVKAAVHFSASRPPDAWTPEMVADTLAGLFPGLGAEHVRSAECWYTLTPDQHFVVGRHPGAERVVLACGFSGHGFKFTPVLGEVIADLVTDGSTTYDLSLFDPRRFAG
ncbi:MAG: N-methyl-L-tryptophan oxidase [Actinomycetes bacterium]